MTTLALFPTPVETIPNAITDLERLYLEKKVRSLKHNHHQSIKGDGFSTHNPHETYPILSDDIRLRLQKILDEYNIKVGNFPSKITYVWSNIQNQGSILKEHCHPNSLVSGALYINVEDGSKLYFHNPNSYIYYSAKENVSPYNMEHQWLPVENGTLLLFPSWLRHGKDDEYNTIHERIVISFNAV
tara:strand:- start:711 stop:1268 length:558 start_codon:yes stop_codon:yes gene_type:complete